MQLNVLFSVKSNSRGKILGFCLNSIFLFRKRKQRNPAKVTSPIFNRKTRRLDNNGEEDDTDQGFGDDGLDDEDAMMAEAENAINILSLLEKKKKGLKKDGLYKFVLWREALKDEKSKMSV